MDLRCEQVLKRLGPLTDAGELMSRELPADVREHVDRCADCQAFLRRDASLRRRLQTLRTAAAGNRFPEASRTALLARLALEGDAAEPDIGPGRSRRSRRWPAWTEAAVAAAAAIALLAGGLTISQRIREPLSDRALARDFIQAALPEISSGHFTATQVAAFYEQQFGGQMSPARLLDAPVTKVAVCDVDGRRGAMVVYDFEGERLAYYQFPLNGAAASDGLTSRMEGDLNVTRWRDERSEHVIVSRAPSERLEGLARERMN